MSMHLPLSLEHDAHVRLDRRPRLWVDTRLLPRDREGTDGRRHEGLVEYTCSWAEIWELEVAPWLESSERDESKPGTESGSGERDAHVPPTEGSLFDEYLDTTGPVDGCLLAPSEIDSLEGERGADAWGESETFDALAATLDSILGSGTTVTVRDLQDPLERRHVWTRVFTMAELRRLESDPNMGDFVDFHRCHKYLWLAYDEACYREMGPLMGNPDHLAPPEIGERYLELGRRALETPPSRGGYVNALQHAYGHFDEQLTDDEREVFESELTAFHAGDAPLESLLAHMRAWCRQYDAPYLNDQVLLAPYPRDLHLWPPDGTCGVRL